MNINICRLCLDSDGTYNIFDQQEVCIRKKIQVCCVNLVIKQGDGLPAHICNSCNQQLTAFYEFVLKCEASEKKMRSGALEIHSCNEFKKYSPKVEVKTEYDNFDEHVNELVLDEIKVEIDPQVQEVRKRPYNRRKKHKEHGVCSCLICGRRCANASTLVTHMRSHTDERPFSCPSCNKSYKDSGSLKRHSERNHSQDKRKKDIICDHCGKAFFTKSDVQVHIRTHTGETPYSCPFCQAKFTQISAMLKHKQRHSGDKPYLCSACPKRFCTKEELKNHLAVHSTEKKFSCPLCNVPFKYKNNLKKHIRLHTEVSNYICNYCGQTYKTKGNLKIHIDRKHSEKSGYCNICSKDFANIEIHMWKHTGERPYKCEYCPSSFFELRGMAHHINFKHKKTDRYKCIVDGCLKSFPSRPMLDYHTAKFHDTVIPFPCDRCSRGFYRKNDLVRHKLGTHKEKSI